MDCEDMQKRSSRGFLVRPHEKAPPAVVVLAGDLSPECDKTELRDADGCLFTSFHHVPPTELTAPSIGAEIAALTLSPTRSAAVYF